MEYELKRAILRYDTPQMQRKNINNRIRRSIQFSSKKTELEVNLSRSTQLIHKENIVDSIYVLARQSSLIYDNSLIVFRSLLSYLSNLIAQQKDYSELLLYNSLHRNTALNCYLLKVFLDNTYVHMTISLFKFRPTILHDWIYVDNDDFYNLFFSQTL